MLQGPCVCKSVEGFLPGSFSSVFFHFIARFAMGLWQLAGNGEPRAGRVLLPLRGVLAWGPRVSPHVGRVLKGSYVLPEATALPMLAGPAGSGGAGQGLGSLLRQPGPGQVFAMARPGPCPCCVCSTAMRTEPGAKRWGKAAERLLKEPRAEM